MIPFINLLRLNQMNMQPDNPPPYQESTIPFDRSNDEQAALQSGMLQQTTKSPLDYIPRTVEQDALHQMIANAPPMPDLNHRTKMQRFTAGLVGLGGGADAAQDYMYRPHTEAMKDFTVKAGLQERAATNENQDNTNNRIISQNQMINEDRDLKRQQDLAIAQGKLDVANRNSSIWEGRAKTYADMARGGVPLFDERTGKGYMVYKDGTSVEIDPDHIPEEEKQRAKEEAQKRINAARPGASTTGLQVFQPMDQETGKPLSPVIVNKGTGTSTPITGVDKTTPLAPGRVQTPTAALQTETIKYRNFVNSATVNAELARFNKKPHDFFRTFNDPTTGEEVMRFKDRKEFTDPLDLQLYDFLFNLFKGKK